MATRLCEVVVDCADPISLGVWWAETLGWAASTPEPGEVELRAPGSDATMPALLFLAVPEPKRVKNRIHLDLASQSRADQAATVERLLDRGASHADIGQGEVPWVVLADPEGNEFCALEFRDRYVDAGPLAAIVADARDPEASARFWVEATGWRVGFRGDGIVSLHRPGGRPPDLDIVRVGDPERVKLRWHLDVAPDHASTVADEATRLRAIGAVDVDIGQHADPATDWVVLADPEGNEFCVVPG